MIIRGLLISMLVGMTSLPFAAQLIAMDTKANENKTSIFLSLNDSAKPKVFALKNPYRIVLDFSQTELKFKINSAHKSANGLIKDIRSGVPKPHTLRIVFEMKEEVDYHLGAWQRAQSHLKGMRLDLTRKATINAAKNPVKVQSSPLKRLREVVVVIDAGHGGKDPGARGPKGSREKDVVLAIALKLKSRIDKHPGMRAVLTRKGDYYIGLRQRLDMARKYDGDIFVAIHADAFINRQSNGASVFALSQTGATSEAARWIAEKENYSELGGVDLSDLDDKNGVVRSVLIDLSQTATIGASLQMGQYVLEQLDKMTNLHHDEVEQARFMVLKSPDIPSILVETGFISNPREEKNLNSSAYQERLSDAVFSGIKRYFWQYPPHGTQIEAMSSQQIHWVRAGDTLSGIATHYHTNLSALCTANRVSKTEALKIGQKLIIPSSWS